MKSMKNFTDDHDQPTLTSSMEVEQIFDSQRVQRICRVEQVCPTSTKDRFTNYLLNADREQGPGASEESMLNSLCEESRSVDICNFDFLRSAWQKKKKTVFLELLKLFHIKKFACKSFFKSTLSIHGMYDFLAILCDKYIPHT